MPTFINVAQSKAIQSMATNPKGKMKLVLDENQFQQQQPTHGPGCWWSVRSERLATAEFQLSPADLQQDFLDEGSWVLIQTLAQATSLITTDKQALLGFFKCHYNFTPQSQVNFVCVWGAGGGGLNGNCNLFYYSLIAPIQGSNPRGKLNPIDSSQLHTPLQTCFQTLVHLTGALQIPASVRYVICF